MARIIQQSQTSKTKTVKERTFGVTLNTPAHVPGGKHTAQVNREIATYIDGKFDESHRLPIPATAEDGGFESKIELTVQEIMDSTEIPVKYLPEIISKGCDYISDKRREERRVNAGGE